MRTAGRSYHEIHVALGIPKSTLSGWFKNLELAHEARARLDSRKSIGTEVLIRRNKLQTANAERRAEEAKVQGRKEIARISADMLALLGTALYWAEGYKRLRMKDGKEKMSHTISFVNADEVMIRAFLKFLKDILNVDDRNIQLCMRLYEPVSEVAALRYWTKITGFPKENFRGTTYLVSVSSRRKRPFRRLPFGTLQVQVCNTQKFHQLLGMIEGVKKQF